MKILILAISFLLFNCNNDKSITSHDSNDNIYAFDSTATQDEINKWSQYLNSPIEQSRIIYQNKEIPMNELPEGLNKSVGDWNMGTDGSGTIHFKVWETTSYGQHNKNITANVNTSEGYVLVGGGAWADYGTGAGGLLVASYPLNEDLVTWVATSKDHLVYSPHTLHVYAIGMKLNGLTRSQLMTYMHFQEATSGSQQQHNTAIMNMNSNYNMIGGGAKVHWEGSGAGALLTHSYPSSTSQWVSKSKDHGAVYYHHLSSYGIGISKGYIGYGFNGYVQVNMRNAASTFISSGTSAGLLTAQPTPGWVISCPGARSDWWTGVRSRGRLLTRLGPSENMGNTMYAGDKPHASRYDDGWFYLDVIEVKRQ